MDQILAQSDSPDSTKEESLSQPNNVESKSMMDIGSGISHYLPEHATAAATISATAQNLFDILRPKTIQNSPLDKPAPTDKGDIAKYNRALDIAQQPLMVLHHIGKGTLQQSDVETLQALYPGLHSAMVQSLSEELINAKNDGTQIPYFKRKGISMLMGSPIDSTMTPASAQAIINSGGPLRNKTESQGQKRASGTELRQVNKVNDLYMTKPQSGEKIRND